MQITLSKEKEQQIKKAAKAAGWKDPELWLSDFIENSSMVDEYLDETIEEGEGSDA
jgi:predicted secreted hydrolase